MCAFNVPWKHQPSNNRNISDLPQGSNHLLHLLLHITRPHTDTRFCGENADARVILPHPKPRSIKLEISVILLKEACNTCSAWRIEIIRSPIGFFGIIFSVVCVFVLLCWGARLTLSWEVLFSEGGFLVFVWSILGYFENWGCSLKGTSTQKTWGYEIRFLRFTCWNGTCEWGDAFYREELPHLQNMSRSANFCCGNRGNLPL